MLRSIGNALSALDRFAEWLLFDVPAFRRLAGRTIALAGCIGLLAALWPAHRTQQATDSMFLTHRPWYTKLPERWDSPYSYMWFTDNEVRKGAFYALHEVGSPARWLGHALAFRAEDGKLTIYTLHDHRTTETSFKITRGDFGGFDLKLELSSDPMNGGKPQAYFSRVDRWRRSPDSLPERHRGLVLPLE